MNTDGGKILIVQMSLPVRDSFRIRQRKVLPCLNPSSSVLLPMEVLFIGANFQAAKPINCSVLARRAANNAVITRRPLSVTA
jgi:hypothetical protein